MVLTGFFVVCITFRPKRPVHKPVIVFKVYWDKIFLIERRSDFTADRMAGIARYEEGEMKYFIKGEAPLT